MLHLRNIHRSFGPVQALRGVDLDVYPGSVLGLVGENGAGKSTLVKIISGALLPDRGDMTLTNAPYAPLSPLDGRRAGIAMIYQELTLAPHLTVEENVTLGLENHRYGWLQPRRKEVRDILDWLDQEDIEPETPVGRLGPGKQQVVEIARALVSDARVVVMDEPTSSLSATDTKALFRVVKRLRDRGVAVVYISHFLEEVQGICDTVTVLRDGEVVSSSSMSATSLDQIVLDMVGRSVDELYPSPDGATEDTAVEVDGLRPAGSPCDVSFSINGGEIIGVAGLVGAGRTEMLRALFGLDPADSGSIRIRREPSLDVQNLSPSLALESGLDLLSEDRKDEGLALDQSILWNLTLSAIGRYSSRGLIDRSREIAAGNEWTEALGIRHRAVSQPAATLSGGNQQKLCLARLLHHDSQVLLLDEPTRGVDIASKAEIYRIVRDLASAGKTIVVVSSYLPELLGICHRLGVMHRGNLSALLPVREWTEHSVMLYATTGRFEGTSS